MVKKIWRSKKAEKRAGTVGGRMGSSLTRVYVGSKYDLKKWGITQGRKKLGVKKIHSTIVTKVPGG